MQHAICMISYYHKVSLVIKKKKINMMMSFKPNKTIRYVLQHVPLVVNVNLVIPVILMALVLPKINATLVV